MLKLKPTIDSLAAYMITDLAIEARRDPEAFLRALDDCGGTDRFTELLIIDEFDVPDDLYWLFDINGDNSRLDALLALRDKVQLYELVHSTVIRLRLEMI